MEIRKLAAAILGYYRLDARFRRFRRFCGDDSEAFLAAIR
jgi:hypothetical protein